MNKLGEGVKKILNTQDQTETSLMDEFSNVKFPKNKPIVY